MKFRCDRDALSEALQTVQRGVSSRPGIPALTGVLLEAASEGSLTLTTTDLEVSARLAIEVQVAEEGTALVPARLLGDTVKSLSDAPVEFESDQGQAHIRCAAYEGALRLLPAEDFPALQPPTGTRVVAWSDLTGHAITTDLAEHALEDLLPQAEAEIPPQVILEESAKYFGLSVEDLVSPNRSRPLTTARHVAMYLMRECSGQSLVKIGDTFGGRDHTTARHGILKIERDMRARSTTYRQVQDLSRIVRDRARGT